jgi:hypothetical protein
VTRGSGYSQWAGLPTIVDCFHHISRELYIERSKAAWPETKLTPGTTNSEIDVSEIDRQRNRVLVQEQDDILKTLFEKVDAKFRPGD